MLNLLHCCTLRFFQAFTSDAPAESPVSQAVRETRRQGTRMQEGEQVSNCKRGEEPTHIPELGHVH